jgi:hypothetical protein
MMNKKLQIPGRKSPRGDVSAEDSRDVTLSSPGRDIELRAELKAAEILRPVYGNVEVRLETGNSHSAVSKENAR